MAGQISPRRYLLNLKLIEIIVQGNQLGEKIPHPLGKLRAEGILAEGLFHHAGDIPLPGIVGRQLGNEIGSLVRNITLFAVLVYELVGPMLTKICLQKAGEIVPKAVAVIDEDDDE